MLNGFKLGIDGQQAAYRFILVDPNYIRVLNVVSQCNKYSNYRIGFGSTQPAGS